MILAFFSAILGIIAFLPANFYPVVFVFLVPLFIFFLREQKLWRLILGAFLFRFIFSLGVVSFTLEPILWVTSLLIFLGLPVSIFLFKKFTNKTASVWSMLIFLPLAWTFFDHLQAYFSFFPTYIATAGNALGSSPFLGLARAGGFWPLTFFVAVINTLVVAIIWQRRNRRQVLLFSITIIFILFSVWQFSVFALRQNEVVYNSLPNSFSVAVISTDSTFPTDSFKELVTELSNKKSDLVVFPENIFNQPTSDLIFQNTAKELNTPLLAAYDRFQNGNKYGSAILFNPQGNLTGIHNKNRLAFIGEYWPFGSWHPAMYDWLKKENPEINDYAIFDQKNADTPGKQNLLSLELPKNSLLFAVPICLEIHYPADLKEYQQNGAKFVVNQASNRWISADLDQYLYETNNLKKIEAVWLGLPIVSSGVNDVAGIILPNGQTQSNNYENGNKNNKNYEIFFGEIRY